MNFLCLVDNLEQLEKRMSKVTCSFHGSEKWGGQQKVTICHRNHNVFFKIGVSPKEIMSLGEEYSAIFSGSPLEREDELYLLTRLRCKYSCDSIIYNFDTFLSQVQECLSKKRADTPFIPDPKRPITDCWGATIGYTNND